jgi:hypothetical protein
MYNGNNNNNNNNQLPRSPKRARNDKEEEDSDDEHFPRKMRNSEDEEEYVKEKKAKKEDPWSEEEQDQFWGKEQEYARFLHEKIAKDEKDGGERAWLCNCSFYTCPDFDRRMERHEKKERKLARSIEIQ